MYAAAEVNDHVGTQKESGRVMWKPRKDTSERSKPADSGCCLASHENQEKINFFWVNHSVYFVMAVYEGGYASFTQ